MPDPYKCLNVDWLIEQKFKTIFFQLSEYIFANITCIYYKFATNSVIRHTKNLPTDNQQAYAIINASVNWFITSSVSGLSSVMRNTCLGQCM